MADFHASLSPSVLRNLADKLYEKRKTAALEVEDVVRALTLAKDHQTISKIIALLTYDFALSPQANHRKSSVAKEEYKATKPGEQGRAGLSGSNRARDNPPNLHPFLNRKRPNYLNGGLIGLAAATVGLASDAAQHLEKIVPPVLKSFTDEDSRVRYYACEALYNIAQVVRGDFIVFFNDIFDALCKLSADSDPNVRSAADLLDRLVKDIVTVQDSPESDQFSIEEFIPLLRERMNVLNPFIRRFLVGWITELDKVPAIDMLGFLPDFLDGLFNMLSDSSREIRQQADLALKEFMQDIQTAPSVDYGRMAEILVQRAGSPDEFTRLTAITWINEFVKLGGEKLVPYFADILGVVLPAISDREEKIQAVARETNEEMRAVRAEPSEGFDIGAVLVIARRELGNDYEATRLEALRWISVLLERHRTEVLSFLDDIFPALLRLLSDPSDEVALLVLEVQACIARDPQHFRHLMGFLVHLFNSQQSLLERRGALAFRRLCQFLRAERVYRELAAILDKEGDLVFATTMVQALNLILLTAPELADLRGLLREALSSPGGRDLFVALYASWCHSPMATVSLCLLAQAYPHASSVIQSLGETDISVNLLVQIDKLVRLLETPIFAYLRLQLLEPDRYPQLLKTLYGLLMLLPQQSSAFKILRTRLKTVPSHSFMLTPPNEESNPSEFPVLSTIRRAVSAGPFTAQILAQIPPLPISSLSLQPAEDAESSSGVAGSIVASQLRHFEQLQYQLRSHNAVENDSRPPRRPPVSSNQNEQGAEAVPDSETSRGVAPRSPRSVPISPRYGAQLRS